MAASALVAGWDDPFALQRLVSFATDPRRPIANLNAARELQLLGEHARPAIPVMRRLRDESKDVRVQEAMKAALSEIQGAPDSTAR